MGRHWAFSFFSLSVPHQKLGVGSFFHFFVNNLQFCCKISGLVENVFHLASWVVPCWFIGFLENSFRDQTPLHPTGSQPINNTTPSCNSNTRISPDKTIIFFRPFFSIQKHLNQNCSFFFLGHSIALCLLSRGYRLESDRSFVQLRMGDIWIKIFL